MLIVLHIMKALNINFFTVIMLMYFLSLWNARGFSLYNANASSVSIEHLTKCTSMLFTFENGVPLMRQGASVVWHHSLLLMNSFNINRGCFFSCRLCFLMAFPFSLICLIRHSSEVSVIIWNCFTSLRRFYLAL